MNNESLSLATPKPIMTSKAQMFSLTLLGIAVLLLIVVGATGETISPYILPGAVFLSIVSMAVFVRQEYLKFPEGIKNNGVWFKSMSARGVLGWLTGIILTGFYVLLYWFPAYVGFGGEGVANTGLVALFDPLSRALNGKNASQWFLYGTLYTIAILVMGIKFIIKYRHNRYQIYRTISVMVAQLFLAYLIPEILEAMNSGLPYFAKDLKNIWPLNYYFYKDWHVDAMLQGGSLGMFYLVWGIILTFVATPFLTYHFGKRWYCSWVCGCGGLAETAGDPYRQLSDKSTEAWQVERYLIHGVLVFVSLATTLMLYTYFSGDYMNFNFSKYWLYGLIIAACAAFYFLYKKARPKHTSNRILLILIGIVAFSIFGFEWRFVSEGTSLNFNTGNFYEWYAFFIGATFSGVIGVGFYPLLGSRVWCRFGCPMAAILGIFQRTKSKFRITTNGGQCISCGNCSTYCEMGIDVRHYAQRGQDVVRASCVGCGICSAVCPRGVLRLEGASEDISERAIDVRNTRLM